MTGKTKIDDMLAELEALEGKARPQPWFHSSWWKYHAAARNALPTLIALARLAVEAKRHVGTLHLGESEAVEKWHADFDALTADEPKETE